MARFRPWMALVLVIVATGLLRWRLAGVPLERDEGEYAYMGQLMLHGVAPYGDSANMKLPGTYAAYALLMLIFGQTSTGIHWGFICVNAANTALIYFLGRRLLGPAQGVAAAAAYSLFSVAPGVLGTQAHATHFVLLPALAGLLLLLRHARPWRASALWCSGLLFGLAFLMKQQGVVFGVFGAVYVAARCWKARRELVSNLAALLGGAVTPIAFACLLLWRAGVFSKFWFWTVTYARAYEAESSLQDGLRALGINTNRLLSDNGPLWFLAAVGLAFVWWKPERRRVAWFLTAFLVFAFLGVCPGLYFRPHYFVLLLPAVALLAGAVLTNRTMYWVFGAALVFCLGMRYDFYFQFSPSQVLSTLYPGVPFAEMVPIGEYLRTRSPKNARVAVLGSEPEIYFYSQRRSATSYLYMYPLMETQPYALKMQQDLEREVETVAPEYIVFAAFEDSWAQTRQSSTMIFKWWEKYRAANYHLVGVADLISASQTIYRWDEAAADYHRQSPYYVTVFRRNASP